MDLSLPPDGVSVAYMVPTSGQGSTLAALSLVKGSAPHAALEPLSFTRLVAVNADGSNLRLLSTKRNSYSRFDAEI